MEIIFFHLEKHYFFTLWCHFFGKKDFCSCYRVTFSEKNSFCFLSLFHVNYFISSSFLLEHYSVNLVIIQKYKEEPTLCIPKEKWRLLLYIVLSTR